MAPDLPRRAGNAVPDAVPAEDQTADAAARRARVTSAGVSTVQGSAERPIPQPSGREASHSHQTRRRPGRREPLTGQSVWQHREACGGMIATVGFSDRASRGGGIDRIVVSRLDDGEPVTVDRSTSRDELCCALEAPVWVRFGSLAGQPQIADGSRGRPQMGVW